MLSANSAEDNEALARLTVILCDVTGKDVKRIIYDYKKDYCYQDVEKDWKYAEMSTITPSQGGHKAGENLIIVPGSQIIGLVEDKFNQKILGPTGIINYDVRPKGGFNYLIGSDHSKLF